MRLDFRHMTLYSFSMTCALLTTKYFRIAIPDVILHTTQALVLIVAIGVLFAYTLAGQKTLLNTIYIERVGLNLPLPLLQIIDIIVHFLPPIILGLPKSSIGVFIACAISLTWYAIFRDKMHDMYLHQLEVKTYDSIMICAVVFVLLISCITTE